MAPASEEQDRRSTAGTNPLLIREKGKTNGMQTVVFFWGEPEKNALLSTVSSPKNHWFGDLRVPKKYLKIVLS